MASNLVTLVMQYLPPDMIERIANALGLDRNTARSAIGTSVPALLAGLMGTAQQPGGAQRLTDAVRQQAGTLDNFSDHITSGEQSTLAEKGSRVLSSLLGGQDQNALVGAISRFSGLGQGTAGSLMGLLTPVVLGTIAKQMGSRFDAGTLTSMLSSQKSNIANALPSGFSNLLGGTKILDTLSGTAATTAEAGQSAASYVTRTARDAGQRTSAASASTSYNWLYWAIPLAALGALIWYLVSAPEQNVSQAPPPAPTETVGSAGASMSKQLSDQIGTMRSALVGVTDVDSAKAALPKLNDATTKVDQLGNMQMSADQRKTMSDVVKPAMPQLNQQFERVLAIPGVSEVLKPTIDTLKAKLQTIAT
jgi:hypothetical protein